MVHTLIRLISPNELTVGDAYTYETQTGHKISQALIMYKGNVFAVAQAEKLWDAIMRRKIIMVAYKAVWDLSEHTVKQYERRLDDTPSL